MELKSDGEKMACASLKGEST